MISLVLKCMHIYIYNIYSKIKNCTYYTLSYIYKHVELIYNIKSKNELYHMYVYIYASDTTKWLIMFNISYIISYNGIESRKLCDK